MRYIISNFLCTKVKIFYRSYSRQVLSVTDQVNVQAMEDISKNCLVTLVVWGRALLCWKIRHTNPQVYNIAKGSYTSALCITCYDHFTFNEIYRWLPKYIAPQTITPRVRAIWRSTVRTETAYPPLSIMGIQTKSGPVIKDHMMPFLHPVYSFIKPFQTADSMNWSKR